MDKRVSNDYVVKTTLLNTLALEISPGERVITLEDTAELHLPHPHVVRLETREATPDGVGEVTLAHLLRTALRLRPDRLVVGEIRGDEAVHLLQALNTGHDGSMATVHANSATDALARLSSLVLHEVGNWPLMAVQHHVVRAVDAVVHVARGPDGARRVVEVAEVRTDLQGDAAAPAIATRRLADASAITGLLQRRRR
jgi:pilus assembly protein CpaF